MAGLEFVVQDSVEALGFANISLCAIWDPLFRQTVEVVCLSLHGSLICTSIIQCILCIKVAVSYHTAMLPSNTSLTSAQIIRIRKAEFMLWIIVSREISLDGRKPRRQRNCFCGVDASKEVI